MQHTCSGHASGQHQSTERRMWRYAHTGNSQGGAVVQHTDDTWPVRSEKFPNNPQVERCMLRHPAVYFHFFISQAGHSRLYRHASVLALLAKNKTHLKKYNGHAKTQMGIVPGASLINVHKKKVKFHPIWNWAFQGIACEINSSV